MFFQVPILSLAALVVSFASAAPAATSTASSPAATSSSFYLKAHIKHDQPAHKWDGYYVDLFHTGAGLDDVVLRSDIGPSVYLNGTDLLWNAEEGETYTTQWGDYYDGYASWSSMHVNIPTEYFGNASVVINGTYLVGSPDTESGFYGGWAGWRVCEWFHQGLPQLFFDFPNQNVTIHSCAEVELEVVPV